MLGTGSNRALRTAAAVFAAGLIGAACAGTAATPSPGSAAPWTPPVTPWDGPTYELWSPPSDLPWSEDSASPGPTTTPWPLSGSLDFPVAKGKAALAMPAEDYGAAAAVRINDFGFDLLRHLDAEGNLCASPASVALALAMVRPGARGTTATEMDQVLHSFGAPGQGPEIVALLQQLSQQNIYADADGNALMPEDTPDPANPNPLVELRVANQAFAQKGMTVEQAYLDALSSNFGAGVGLLDFMKDPEAARLTINKWGNDNTHGRIPDVLQPGDVDKMTRIALANAIYLKAAWGDPFDAENTKPRAFTTASGASVTVPTMAKRRELPYVAGSGYRATELSLTGYSLTMTIIVPDNMASFTGSLTSAKLTALIEAMSPYDVDLTLPRFSVNTRFDLSDVLESMGMTAAFDWTKADLTGITTDPIAQPLYIQKVIHQANIDVVEEGVTAAAVTVVLGGKGMAGPGEPPPYVKFQVNKPFLYLIRDQQSGVVLFVGRVNDPSPAG